MSTPDHEPGKTPSSIPGGADAAGRPGGAWRPAFMTRHVCGKVSGRRALLAFGGVLAIGLFGSVAGGCRRGTDTKAPPAAAALALTRHRSAECRSCHEEIYKAWSDSHHAHAHRPVDPNADAEAFTPTRRFELHGVDYQVELENGKPTLTESRPGREPQRFTADYVLGYTPLRQFVVPAGGGRHQLTELAWDPARKEWFNMFGDERRQPGEWGHWLGRGMNWNSMCAHCHITDFRKNYNAVTDTYAPTWTEHGVGCVQCHGNLAPNHTDPNRRPVVQSSKAPDEPKAPAVFAAERQRMQETCAPCHARNELLTGKVLPEVPYNDHYRLTLPLEPTVFYPDGQVLDEDFNYTSILTSRMGGKAGVTCLDCHEPHAGKPRLPVENNAICMQCHGAPGRLNAVIIDPLAHSQHKPDSKGNQCVECHMSKTTYMQRDPRHDHGFLKPDPLLTKELGIPNACNRCHTDQTVDWAITHADQWYGDKMNSRQRQRARVVAAAQAGKDGATERLLEFIANEDIPAWKATLLLLTRPHAANPAVLAAARAATTDEHPLVRSAAAQVLATSPGNAPALRPLLKDPSRLVRLDAAWALSPELPEASPERKELEAYLAVAADQPTGRLRIAQDLYNRGRTAEAVPPLRVAADWDPNSPGIHETLGLVLDALGRSDEAAASLWRAAQLNTREAQPAMNAALAFAAAGKISDAEVALREAVRRDPRLDRAWYNLGLLLAQTRRAAEAIEALQTAERVAPNAADYPYARATILWQQGHREAAQAAARRALEIDPNHPNARQQLGAPR